MYPRCVRGEGEGRGGEGAGRGGAGYYMAKVPIELMSSCFLTIGKIGRINFELKIQPLHSLCKARGPVLGRPFTPRVYLAVSPIFFYGCKIKYGIS